MKIVGFVSADSCNQQVLGSIDVQAQKWDIDWSQACVSGLKE